MMRYALLAIVSVISGATPAQAATKSDFFCTETLKAPPMYYAKIVKSCGDGKTETEEGVCGLTVNCAYVDGNVKEVAKESTGKDFAALTDEQKKKFLKENDEVDWFTTNLTCKGKRKNGVFICPGPEQCKGDVFYYARPAKISQSAFDDIILRENRGIIRSFQVAPSAGAAK